MERVFGDENVVNVVHTKVLEYARRAVTVRRMALVLKIVSKIVQCVCHGPMLRTHVPMVLEYARRAVIVRRMALVLKIVSNAPQMWSVCSAVNGVGLQSQRGQQYQVERAGGVGLGGGISEGQWCASSGLGHVMAPRISVGLQSQRGQQYQVERAGGGQQYQVCASSVRIERAWTCLLYTSPSPRD